MLRIIGSINLEYSSHVVYIELNYCRSNKDVSAVVSEEIVVKSGDSVTDTFKLTYLEVGSDFLSMVFVFLFLVD